MLPAFSGSEGVEHAGLQGENGKGCLGQIQHPDGRIHGMDMLSVFCYADKAAGDFIKGEKLTKEFLSGLLYDYPSLFIDSDIKNYNSGITLVFIN